MATINIPIGNNILKRGDTIQEIVFSFDALDNIDLTDAKRALEDIEKKSSITLSDLIEKLIEHSLYSYE